MPQKDLHEANRLSWNAATAQHLSHRTDQVAFYKNGGSTLFPEDIELLGDVRGKSLLHLQCNAGQDTVSIASQLGAVVTGVDISDTAIEAARQLSADTGITAVFHRADILDWMEQNHTLFDVIYTSYGVLVWLSDLEAWGRGIARTLKPGGRFVLMEFHPFATLFDNHEWKLRHPYSGGKPVCWQDGVGDYLADGGGENTNTGEKVEQQTAFVNPYPSYEFPWGVAEIVTALIDAGLRLSVMREYTHCNGWMPVGDMVELPGRQMVTPDGIPAVPLMLGIVATR